MKHDWYFLIYWYFWYTDSFSVLGSLHRHALLPWWNATCSTCTRAQTCSTWWHTWKWQDASAKLQIQMHKLWEVHDESHTSAPCLWSREHSGIHLQRQKTGAALSQTKRESCTSLISPGPEPWLRWTCEGEGSRTARSSASFCSNVVCAQGTTAEQCQGQMPTRKEIGRIKGVALLLCTVERLKHWASFHIFVFKVTIKGRDYSSALTIWTSSTHSFFNAQNFVVRYPSEHSTYKINRRAFWFYKKK